MVPKFYLSTTFFNPPQKYKSWVSGEVPHVSAPKFKTASSEATDTATARRASTARRFVRSRGKAGSEANPSPQRSTRAGRESRDERRSTGRHHRALCEGPHVGQPQMACALGPATPAAGLHPAGQRRTHWPPRVLRAPPEKGGGHGPSEGQEGGEQKGDPGCRGTAGTAPQGRPALGAPFSESLQGGRRGEAGLCNPSSRGCGIEHKRRKQNPQNPNRGRRAHLDGDEGDSSVWAP